MKPKIILINQAYRKRRLYANTLPPLGILGIAAYLEKNNFAVDIVDYCVEPNSRINLVSYDLVGLSINMANIAASLELIRHIKTQNLKVKIIVGGPSCISNPQYFMQNELIDAVCTGEGEEPFLDYVQQEAFSSAKEIPGFSIRNGKGSFLDGGKREYADNLDKFPFPALAKIDLRKYTVPIRKRFPVSSLITSRGCPFNCIFCFHSMGHKWRARSALNVVEEIEWQVRQLGVKEICIQDDNFSLDLNRAKQIFDLILKRNLKVKMQFQNGLRVDGLDFELLKKMKQAGVWLIGVAPETGSVNTLEKINKNINLEKVKQVVQWCKKLKINTFAYFMVGFPSESMSDLKQTATFVRELNTDFIQVARVVPLPATPLYDAVANDELRRAFDQESGCFFGIPKLLACGIAAKDVELLIKQIHQSFYLNPVKMLKLMKILPLHRLIKLFIYSITTRNV